jgi:hypothetical protein
MSGGNIDLTHFTPGAILALHARISDELRSRGITRSSNNPTGDLAEYLFCRAFKWEQSGNSKANIDAIDQNGIRYQIKGRRITRFSKSRQLSALRDLGGAHFDYLAAVLFAEDYSVLRAAIIPHGVAMSRAVFVNRTNSHKFILRDDVWGESNVRDVTAELRSVQL